MDNEERGIRVERLIPAEGSRRGRNLHETVFLLLKALLLLLAAFGVAKGFADTFAIPADTWLFPAGVLFLCVLYTVIFSFPKKIKFTLPVWMVVLIVLCILFSGMLADGMKCIYNQAAEQINRYYEIEVPLAAVSPLPPEKQMVSLFVILAFFIGILACGIIYYLDARVTALVMTFPLALALSVGLFLNLSTIILMLVSLVGVFCLQNTKVRESFRQRIIGVSMGGGMLSKLRWQIMTVMAALLLVLVPAGCLWLGPAVNEGYESQSELREDIRNGELINSMRDFWKKLVRGEWDWLPFDIIRSSGVHGGKLSNVKEIRDYNELHLYLDISDDLYAPLYIRGYVGSNYTGKGWKEQTEEQKEGALAAGMSAGDLSGMYYRQLQALRQQGEPAVYGNLRFVITNKDANSAYSYVPYGADISEFGGGEDYDTYPGEKTDENILNMYYMNTQKLSNLQKLEEAGKLNTADAAYRQYVRETYLDVPREGLERFHAEYDGMTFSSAADCVAYVREKLEQNAVYTKTPGATPRGKDYVEYFLYENRQGVCTHFASAAVLMFRTFGIPARYVEGYLTTSLTANEGANEIMDSSAHAWAEIYLDGVGWIPVEVTPGFLNEEDMYDDRESSLTENEMPDVDTQEEESLADVTEEETASRTEPQTDPYVIEAPSTEPQTQPQQKENQPATSSVDQSQENKDNDSDLIRRILKIILTAACVILVLTLLALLVRLDCRRRREKLEKKLMKSRPRDGILAAIAMIGKISREEGLELDEYTDRQAALERYEILNDETLAWFKSLCLEAGFSRHTFDEEIRADAVSFFREFAAYIMDNKKGLKKLIFRYRNGCI